MKHTPLTHARPEWLRRGVMLRSIQEPLVFKKQAGFVPADADKAHWRDHTERFVREAKAAGYNLIILSGQKGAGLVAESEDIEDSRRMARICHRHGLKVGTYIGDTLLTTTAFSEMPESAEWTCVDAYGRPVYYGRQTFRRKACRNNPGYIAFLKKAVEVCIRRIGADLLHFDNFFSRQEPFRCRCRWCAEGFRRFVRARYDDAQLRERYGFTNLSSLSPPPVAPDLEDWRRPVIEDPCCQDWITFHCECLAQAYHELAEYARSLRPDVAIECNPYGLVDRNTAMVMAVDHPRLLPHGDCFWSEEGNSAGVTPEGDVQTRVRSCKMARTLGQALFLYSTPHQGVSSAVLGVCEALAFNQQTLGAARLPEGRVKRCVEFRRRHEDLYLDTALVAEASVLRNFETFAFNNWDAQIEARLAEQALIQGHVPFEMLFDASFEAETPTALVLPDVWCLSDAQADLIRRRVEQGMGLVATADTGQYTPWVRRRERGALDDLFGFRSAADRAWGGVRRREVGRGRCVYLPALPPSRPIPQRDDHYRFIIHQLPVNWREFVEAVRWAGRGPGLDLLAPPTVLAEFLTQSRRLLVHLVNCRETQAVNGIELRLSAKWSRGRRRAQFFSPDLDGPQVLDMTRDGDGRVVRLPLLEVYGVIVVE